MIKSCWKHNRELTKEGFCRDCGSIPPSKPRAFLDTIKEACIKLSYAFPYDNEGEREDRVKFWENKILEIVKRDYEVK